MSQRTKRTFRRSTSERRGTATVEFAFVAIPLFLFVFASIEFGRAMMAAQSLEEAARAGCRIAILNNTEKSEAEAEIDRLLGLAGITTYTVAFDPDPPSTALQFEPVSVTIEASFDDVSWLPLPGFMTGKSFSASCTLPREGDDDGVVQ